MAVERRFIVRTSYLPGPDVVHNENDNINPAVQLPDDSRGVLPPIRIGTGDPWGARKEAHLGSVRLLGYCTVLACIGSGKRSNSLEQQNRETLHFAYSQCFFLILHAGVHCSES